MGVLFQFAVAVGIGVMVGSVGWTKWGPVFLTGLAITMLGIGGLFIVAT